MPTPEVPGTTRPSLALRVAALFVGAATVVSLSACGSSKEGTTSSAPPSSSAPSTAASAAPSKSAGGQPADAATTAAIKEAYSKFFSSATPEGESLGYLQDGQAFKATVEAQAGSAMAQKASAEVSRVTMVSANSAEVTFSILLDGNPMLPNYKGYAVREDGKWKVAGKTFCELMTLQGQTTPACNTPEATSLPD